MVVITNILNDRDYLLVKRKSFQQESLQFTIVIIFNDLKVHYQKSSINLSLNKHYNHKSNQCKRVFDL